MYYYASLNINCKKLRRVHREPEPQQAITEEMDIEPLALLKQGIDVWNEWREQNPEVNLDLTGVNLSGANLELVNLGEVNLKLATLATLLLGKLTSEELTSTWQTFYG